MELFCSSNHFLAELLTFRSLIEREKQKKKTLNFNVIIKKFILD